MKHSMGAQSDVAAARLIDRLLATPAAFPHPAPDLQCIETHISWIVLAGDFAYKFKKPVKLAFLDFSTLALRRAACEEELRINRRTAPQIYLDVAAIGGTPDAPVVLEGDGGAAAVLEVAVKMRRFDQSLLLKNLVQAGALTTAHVDALARHVSAFHEAAARVPADAPWGTAESVLTWARENVVALRGALTSAELRQMLEQTARWVEAEGARLAPLIDQRRAAGHVRECHGDLHLANLVLVDGTPQAFDAIEFNPALRFIDVIADLAFALMDLHSHGRADLAWRLLNGWLERTGDFAGLALLRFHRVDRALVRAKVAALRLAQRAGDDAAEGATAQAETAHYLNQAERSTRSRECRLWLACGVSGSGKSSQSQALIDSRGIVRVRADVERKRLFGLAAELSSAGIEGGIYTRDAGERTYSRLAQAAREVLDAGLPVLIDATFLRRAQRTAFRELAEQLGVPCRILAFDAPVPVLRDRVRRRQLAQSDASEAGVEVLDAQLSWREPLTRDELAIALAVDTSEPVDWDELLRP